MREIAIFGAGELGGATAHALARADVARSVRLVDERGTVARGKALDIAQAAPVEGFATQLEGGTELAIAGGAEVVVVADRFGAGEWSGDDGFGLLRRIGQMAPRAIVICAGASGRDLVDRAVRDLRMPRTRVIGSAPEALAGAARAMVGLALNGSPCDVSLTVLGVPPARFVIPWEDAAAGGFSLVRQLSEPARRQLEMKIAALWPPGPFALAAAAAHVIAAIDGRSRRTASCFVAPDTPDAGRVRTAALPVRLAAQGIVEVVPPQLSVVEGIAFDNAMLL